MAEAQIHESSRVGILVDRIVRTLLRTMMVLLASLLLSIIIEVVGLTYFWSDRGTNKSAEMVQQERVYLGRYAEKNILLKDADGWVFSKIDHLNHGLGRYGGDFLINAWASSTEYVVAIVNTINVFLLRVFVMLFSMPVYLVFGVIGLTRGLVGRELRKWGGGHESASMFHLFMDLITLGFFGSWVIYLSWPFSLNPNVVVLPFAILFGLFVMATAHRYKKYL